MITSEDIGKTFYYSSYDDEEMLGERYSVDAITIDDVSFKGMIKPADSNCWLQADELDQERMFWNRFDCVTDCYNRNRKEYLEVV